MLSWHWFGLVHKCQPPKISRGRWSRWVTQFLRKISQNWFRSHSEREYGLELFGGIFFQTKLKWKLMGFWVGRLIFDLVSIWTFFIWPFKQYNTVLIPQKKFLLHDVYWYRLSFTFSNWFLKFICFRNFGKQSRMFKSTIQVCQTAHQPPVWWLSQWWHWLQ